MEALMEVLNRAARLELPGRAAEDAVIKEGGKVFAGLPCEVEIRNEARVHLWCEEKSGVPRAAHDSTESAIDGFEATTCCLGVRTGSRGRWSGWPAGRSAGRS